MVGYVIVDGRCCSNVAGFVNQPASLTKLATCNGNIVVLMQQEQLGYMNLPIA
jgi:hypothetical protein